MPWFLEKVNGLREFQNVTQQVGVNPPLLSIYLVNLKVFQLDSGIKYRFNGSC